MGEAGFPAVTATNWYGFAVSSKTPAPIVAYLKTAVAKMQAEPAYQDALVKRGVSAGDPGAEAFAAMVGREVQAMEIAARIIDHQDRLGELAMAVENLAIAPAAIRGAAEPSVRPRWRDLREWLTLVEAYGSLRRIDAEVDPEEELSAITWMTTRNPTEPALLFERFAHNPLNTRVLINILGASKQRYALAVGIDPEMSLPDMVQATRQLVKARIPPIHVAKDTAPVNEVVWRGADIDLTKFPAPNSGQLTVVRSLVPGASR